MLAAIFAVTVRHRRPILGTALVLAVILAVGRRLSPWLDLVLGNATFIVGVLASSLAALAWRRSQPAALLVKPEVRAFATAPSASQIAMAVGLMFVALLSLGTGHLAGEGLFLVLPFLLLVGVGLHLAAGWRGVAVELRPDGVHQRDVTGSLTVPWEALTPGRPSRPAARAATLALTYAQPDLVRRRGILRLGRRLRVDNVHPWFIADTIRYYVDHPQHRAAIGEPAEYQRLLHALTSATTASAATEEGCPMPSPNMTRASVMSDERPDREGWSRGDSNP
ncbi:hypothetical protein [Micromonospora chersina]|uniref:hypothetical protein n=1 Tax=Micromonospora chersina TaxID=47854 RepID=UPI00369CD743